MLQRGAPPAAGGRLQQAGCSIMGRSSSSRTTAAHQHSSRRRPRGPVTVVSEPHHQLHCSGWRVTPRLACCSVAGDQHATSTATATTTTAATASSSSSSSSSSNDNSDKQQQVAGDQHATPTATATTTTAATASSSSSSSSNDNSDKQQQVAGDQHATPTSSDKQQLQLRVQVVSGIESVPQAEWDALVASQAEASPFLRWHFLHALEASGSAAPSEGWGPQHVIVRRDDDGSLVGAAPLYLKGHSYGEYVFDSSWASFSHSMGVPYYPKLQSCVPFTPATGNRLLVAPGDLAPLVFKALAQTLVTLTEEMGVSSLHITFPTGEEWAALGSLGFQQRRGIQFHWENRGYASFDDFLADLKQKKRAAIRKERKGVAGHGLAIRRLSGHEVDAATWDNFFDFYQSTIDKHWGRSYLKREFFHRIGADMPDEVLLVVAQEGGETVAAALNLIGSHCIFGRNWGCETGKDFKHLHFELCYYQAIEEAIARKLPRVEAGAQGEHKLQRGLLPNYTYSAHYLADATMRSAVAKFLQREDSQLAYSWQQMTLQGSPFKTDKTLGYLMDKVASYASLSSGGSLSSLDDDAAGSSSSSGSGGQQGAASS